MLLSKMKKKWEALTRREKSGKGYLEKELDLQSPPGMGRHQGDRYSQRKSMLARFKQTLAAKRTHPGGYQKDNSSKKKLIWVLGLTATICSLLLYGVLGGGGLVMDRLGSMPFFQVSDIVFSGTESVSQDALREASGIVIHQTSLIGLDCSGVGAALKTVPWVEQARVEKNWPSTIEISIKENVPVALLHSSDQKGSQLQYIDKKGVMFLQVGPGADIDFPVITGLSDIADKQVRQKAYAEAVYFLNKVKNNNPYLPVQSISEIHLTPEGALVIYLVEYPFPIFFGKSDIKKKYSHLVQVLKAVYKNQKGKGSISDIEYIQMDYLDDKVLVAQSESG